MADRGTQETVCLCRDCFEKHITRAAPAPSRCQSCGSPRLICHPELDALSIAHIDCDAFYASVEKRDDPSLTDKPVIVGGGRRGVVSTACYIARIHGVHSAQPMFKALAACPDAVVIRPDMAKYARIGREIREAMKDLTPLVEPLSIDEAFLDLGGTQRLHRMTPAETLARFAKQIEDTMGLSISIGLSFNKFLAKIASDLEKPRGFSVIGEEEALTFLHDKPVSLIWGVGKAMQKTLARDGVRTIGQLQTMEEADLARQYGTMGLRLYRLARADDTRTVSPDRKAKSVSSETTFNQDIASPDHLIKKLRALSEKVSKQLKQKNLSGQTVVLKLKSADFKIKTRNRKLGDATQLADRIFRTARDLLIKEADGTRYRLIGVGVSDLKSEAVADPHDLIDENAERRAEVERAVDRVRDRFGSDAVKLGLLFNDDTKPQRDNEP